jgi:hypothetical protein
VVRRLLSYSLFGYPAQIYEIGVEEFHNFYITKSDILAHNFVPTLLLGLTQLAAPALMPTIGAAALGALGITFLRNQKNKSDKKRNELQKSFGIEQPDPNDDPVFAPTFEETLAKGSASTGWRDNKKAKDFFPQLKKIADKKAWHHKFDNFYRDPATKRWWTRDTSGHADPHHKVYKETSTGLEWLFDVDMNDNIMVKNKGPVGKFIPYKELVFIA